MVNYSKMDPGQALEKYRIRNGIKGILLAFAAGATWPFVGNLMVIAQENPPYSNYTATIWTITLAGLCVAAVHDLFAGGWLLVYNLLTHRGKEYIRALRSKSAKITLLAGLWGGPVATGCYACAFLFAPAPYVLAINATFPVLGSIFGVIFLKETLSKRSWFGILVVVAGAVLVGWAPPESGNYPLFYVGIILAFVSSIGLAADCATGTYGMDLLDPEIASGIKLFSASLSNIVIVGALVGLATGNGLLGWKMYAEGITMFPYTGILLLAAVFGATTWLVNYRSMNIIGAGRGMALNASFAVFGIPITLLFYLLGLCPFEMTIFSVLGACVLFLGVVMVVINPRELLRVRSHQPVQVEERASE